MQQKYPNHRWQRWHLSLRWRFVITTMFIAICFQKIIRHPTFFKVPLLICVTFNVIISKLFNYHRIHRSVQDLVCLIVFSSVRSHLKTRAATPSSVSKQKVQTFYLPFASQPFCINCAVISFAIGRFASRGSVYIVGMVS